MQCAIWIPISPLQRSEHLGNTLPGVKALDMAVVQERIGPTRCNEACVLVIEFEELSRHAP